jgi:phage virion morphogenesis protein
MTASIEVDDEEIRAALQRLLSVTGDVSPALRNIGEILVPSTQRRFETKTGPDGKAWERNSPVTIERKGRDNPLFERGDLARQIHYALIGDDTLEVGSSLPYAAMQQFGGSQDEFPWLWGDIPARAFLGVSGDDKDTILRIIEAHLLGGL